MPITRDSINNRRIAALGPHRTDDRALDERTCDLLDRLTDAEAGYHIIEGSATSNLSMNANAYCDRCERPIVVSAEEWAEGEEAYTEEGLHVAECCYRCSGILTDLVARDELVTAIGDLVTFRETMTEYAETLGGGDASEVTPPTKVGLAMDHVVRAQRLLQEHLTDMGYPS